MSRSFVMTGTDTGVGKTVVAAGLVAALDADYWKPVQAGLVGGTESETVAALANVGPDRILPEAYRLQTPCSPHEAARIDGVTIDRSRLSLPSSERRLIVEGAGGTLVPINETQFMLDLFADWALPVMWWLGRITQLAQRQSTGLAQIEKVAGVSNARQLGTIVRLDVNATNGSHYLSQLGPPLRALFGAADVLIRPLRNTIFLMPPYSVEKADLCFLFLAIDVALGRLRRLKH